MLHVNSIREDNMRKFVITSDDTTDLPEGYYGENNLEVLHLSYVVDDVVYDGMETKLTNKEFYDKMRNGAMPFTQQVNPENAKMLFEKLVKEGFDIIHIAFTSGLSGTYNSSRLGALEVMEENPDAKITVIDSLCASTGEGLLVHEALKRQKAGMEYDEVVAWVEYNKLRLVHDVVADDLFHLHRGGRVSKVSAVLGTTLKIKPIIHLDEEGKLIPYAKQRHKSAGIKFLVNNLINNIDVSDGLETVAICHSDCLSDAEKVKKLIMEQTDITDIMISNIGPTIGSHTGIGTLAVFYFAENRNVK